MSPTDHTSKRHPDGALSESHKLQFTNTDDCPWLISGRPGNGYRAHPLVVLPAVVHERSWQATAEAADADRLRTFSLLAAVIERELDRAIQDGVNPDDTEMLADCVADALISLPATVTDWEAS
jgi:hypothetical protein